MREREWERESERERVREREWERDREEELATNTEREREESLQHTERERERVREEWANYLSTYLEHLHLENVVVYFLYRQLYNSATSCSNFNPDYAVLTFKYQKDINFDDEKKQSSKTTTWHIFKKEIERERKIVGNREKEIQREK